MTRDGTRPLTALVVTLLLAASLGACGGSDSDSSAGTTATTTAATTTAQEGSKQDDGSSGGSQSQGEDRSQEGNRGSDDGNSGSGNVATPLEVSGGGSAQFRNKGGDNSIQEYGDEGEESELQEVAEIVHGFLVARAEGKWETACSYLSKGNVQQLLQLASQAARFKDASCGQVLKAFTRPLPASIQREVTTVDAGSFRREGEQGFLIYYGAGHTAYAMPLVSEDGTWKLTALSGSELG